MDPTYTDTQTSVYWMTYIIFLVLWLHKKESAVNTHIQKGDFILVEAPYDTLTS